MAHLEQHLSSFFSIFKMEQQIKIDHFFSFAGRVRRIQISNCPLVSECSRKIFYSDWYNAVVLWKDMIILIKEYLWLSKQCKFLFELMFEPMYRCKFCLQQEFNSVIYVSLFYLRKLFVVFKFQTLDGSDYSLQWK